MPLDCKRVLVFDEPAIVNVISHFLEDWGYETIGLQKIDFIENAIAQNNAKLIILPKEMRIKGPSLSDPPDVFSLEPKDLAERVAQLKDTVINFEFGLNIYERLREKNISLPVILTTTDDLSEDDRHYYPTDMGKLNAVFVPKPFGTGEELRKAVVTCLGEGFSPLHS